MPIEIYFWTFQFRNLLYDSRNACVHIDMCVSVCVCGWVFSGSKIRVRAAKTFIKLKAVPHSRRFICKTFLIASRALSYVSANIYAPHCSRQAEAGGGHIVVYLHVSLYVLRTTKKKNKHSPTLYFRSLKQRTNERKVECQNSFFMLANNSSAR